MEKGTQHGNGEGKKPISQSQRPHGASAPFRPTMVGPGPLVDSLTSFHRMTSYTRKPIIEESWRFL